MTTPIRKLAEAQVRVTAARNAGRAPNANDLRTLSEAQARVDGAEPRLRDAAYAAFRNEIAAVTNEQVAARSKAAADAVETERANLTRGRFGDGSNTPQSRDELKQWAGSASMKLVRNYTDKATGEIKSETYERKPTNDESRRAALLLAFEDAEAERLARDPTPEEARDETQRELNRADSDRRDAEAREAQGGHFTHRAGDATSGAFASV